MVAARAKCSSHFCSASASKLPNPSSSVSVRVASNRLVLQGYSPEIRQIQLRHAYKCSTGTPSQVVLFILLLFRARSTIKTKFSLLNDRELGLQNRQRIAKVRERLLRRGQLGEVEMRSRRRILDFGGIFDRFEKVL